MYTDYFSDLNTERQVYRQMTRIPGQTYLNPLNRVRWQEAIGKREKSVTLEDGRQFTLTYYKGDDGKGKVHFTPAEVRGGLVPNGTFDVKTVCDPLWLIAHD